MTVIRIDDAVRNIICTVIICDDDRSVIYTDDVIKIVERIFTAAVRDILKVNEPDPLFVTLVAAFLIRLAKTAVLTDIDLYR